MKTKPFLKATAIALSIVTISGIPASPLTATASASITLGDQDHDAKAIKVIEASIEALGGGEKLEKIKSQKITGTISVPMAGISGVIESYTSTPGKFLLKVDIPGMGVTFQGLNEGIAWSSDPMGGPRILPPEEAKEIIKEADLHKALNFRENNKVIEYLEETEFEGQAAHKLRMVDNDGTESIEYYSVETGLALGSENEVDSPMGKITTTTVLKDYKEFDGYLQPTTMIQKMGPTEILFTFDSAEYNKVDDSVFAFPAAIEALIEATKAKEEAAP